ncbi:MAG: LicD family protein, partial [Muribaculaceae bacterium]|nr:LicD family protein [Muribaculaceae bacterium]
MKKVWQIQLEMVVKLLDICKRHDLKIWAFGGTLLGAVRHGGYIP